MTRGERWWHGRRALAYGAAFLGAAALTVAAALLAVDLAPVRMSQDLHAEVSALPLALIAIAYLAHQPLRRPTLLAVIKSALLACAFTLWAAYQLDPRLPIAVNDLAIALFTLDLALVIGSDLRRCRVPPALTAEDRGQRSGLTSR